MHVCNYGRRHENDSCWTESGFSPEFGYGPESGFDSKSQYYAT